MIMQTIIGGILAVLLYFYTLYRKENSQQLYIGQKIYYYLYDESKKYSGRIMAIITLYREEDISESKSPLRVIPQSERKIKSSQSIIYEIQPIIGGSRITLPEEKILCTKL